VNLLRCLLVLSLFLLGGCDNRKSDDVIIFGTSADYPPFEFYQDGQVVGFEIDLANAIANDLGKRAEFKDMPFSSILLALAKGQIDVALASMTPTKEREEHCAFTKTYYRSVVGVVYKKGSAVPDLKGSDDVTVACQLGTVQEDWVKRNCRAKRISIDNVASSVEHLKTKHVDGIVVDGIVAVALCKENPALAWTVVATLDESGTAMGLKNKSRLVEKIDAVLDKLENSGVLAQLKEKWGLKDLVQSTEGEEPAK
jgi:polar amino acid transport system substrate-binding protein